MNRLIDAYFSGLPFTDHVYANKRVVRRDFSAALIRADLDTLPFDTSKAIWGGFTEAYKYPYENTSMSVYIAGDCDKVPFTTSAYGIKYDYETGIRTYKAEVPEFTNPFPELNLVSSSKVYRNCIELPTRDYYGFETSNSKEAILAFCENHNLEYPLPEEYTGVVWGWGITTDENDVPVVVKAYVAKGV